MNELERMWFAEMYRNELDRVHKMLQDERMALLGATTQEDREAHRDIVNICDNYYRLVLEKFYGLIPAKNS